MIFIVGYFFFFLLDIILNLPNIQNLFFLFESSMQTADYTIILISDDFYAHNVGEVFIVVH